VRQWSLLRWAQAKGASRFASKFIDGAPRLAAGVREVDGIDSFPPLLPVPFMPCE